MDIMKNIIEFITEKLKISSSSQVHKGMSDTEIPDKVSDKIIVTDDELSEIERYAEDLPVKPNIKIGRNGNVKLEFETKVRQWGNDKGFNYINISKPERYHGSFKITMTVGNYAPYEFPMGNKYTDKNGKLLLPDIESVFKQINKQWEKRDLTNLYKK